MTSIEWDCCRHGEGARLPFQFAARSGTVRKCWRCAPVYPPILWRSVKIGILVGSVLAVINHGGALVRGELTSGVAWKIALTYLVPFVVATWGALAASRISSSVEAGGRGRGLGGQASGRRET